MFLPAIGAYSVPNVLPASRIHFAAEKIRTRENKGQEMIYEKTLPKEILPTYGGHCHFCVHSAKSLANRASATKSRGAVSTFKQN